MFESHPAREYHAATKHFPGASARRRVLDATLIPKPSKRYLDLPSFPLQEPASSADASRGLTLAGLAALLHYSAGIVRRCEINGRVLEFRAASCTGAAYHIELYLVCGGIEHPEPGVYHYDVAGETLRQLRAGDFRAVVAAATGTEAGDAGAFVILTSTFWRNAWRYQERAYRHAFWDAGTIAANLLALSGSFDLPHELHAGFVDAEVNRLLGLDPRREAAVCVMALGRGTEYAPAPGVEAITPAVEPLSAAEIEYPLIWRTHAATGLPDAEAVRRWHRQDVPETLGPDIATVEPLQAVIERRGSTRRFRDAALTRREFDTLLQAATTPLPADFPALSQASVVVHNVEGMSPGVYPYEAGRLHFIRAGNLQNAAGHAALDQTAAARAAVNLYFTADLDAVLKRFGDRGYRAAQIEGGVRGGRVYLQATALGLRATGLTFYDDEAVRLLDAPPDTAVLFLIAVGR